MSLQQENSLIGIYPITMVKVRSYVTIIAEVGVNHNGNLSDAEINRRCQAWCRLCEISDIKAITVFEHAQKLLSSKILECSGSSKKPKLESLNETHFKLKTMPIKIIFLTSGFDLGVWTLSKLI